MTLRKAECRTCGETITFGRGRNDRWVPCEVASVTEYVEAEGGGFHYEPKLGHRRHECSRIAGANIGGSVSSAKSSPRPAPRRARGSIDAALAALEGEVRP